jgi:poly(A) polymerase
VGGCVRDLLLGLVPKDYDIATAARPPQVKRTFPRNSRIIGRRFKLAHLHFNNNTKILEVSTFRRTPQMDNADDDLLITRDNEFGTAEEDALRRDFTVNALFLDPTGDRILDYTDGLKDVRERIIRTIGDPRVRFREDPVRILRAAKFAARLGFTVEPDTLAAMAEASPDLVRAAPPRLLEEILRLLRGGHALDSFQLLRDVGALKSLLPEVANFLAQAPQPQRVAFWRMLEALDHRVHEGRVPSNPVLLGVLFATAVSALAEQQPTRSASSIAEELLGPLSVTLRLPRRDAGCLKRICGVQHRFLQADGEKRFKLLGFLHGPYFEEALELFELRAAATGVDPTVVGWWHDQIANRGQRAEPPADDRETTFERRGAGTAGTAIGGEPAEAVDDAEPADTADTEEPAAVAEPAGADATPTADRGSDGDGRRRRRRRRRRRGRGGDREPDAQAGDGAPGGADAPAGDERDDDSEPAAPESEPALASAQPDGPPDGLVDGPPEGSHGDDEGLEHEALESGPEPAAGDDEAATSVAEGPGGEPGSRRRRRRRRRRGRGRGGEGQAGAPAGGPAGGTGSEGPAGDAAAREPQQQQRHRQQQQQRQQHHQHQQQHQQQHARRDDDGGRGRRRRGRRNRGGPGGNRDVDVVPRHVDRRGKVDVIEPPPLDLSAFDVELDPRRVPTFGSIVEGKGRPKRKGPRVPGDDDYRPPPPPGGSPGPDAPPPPPPSSSEPDTFGDW